MARFFQGLRRGFLRKCPNCGHGKLFAGYLKLRRYCDHCGHENGIYRADDAPPYVTLFLVGHFFIAPMLALSFVFTWPVVLTLAVTLPGLTVITLGLLPFVKGAVVGIHWAVDVVSSDKPMTP